MTIRLKIDPVSPDEGKIAIVLAVLRRGGVIAYPTETFYGLGADAGNEKAIERVFALKGRDFRNPVSVIIAAAALPSLAAEIPEYAKPLMEQFWPGPLTLVFPALPSVSSLLTAGTGRIGVRISSHPLANLLAGMFGAPLTATSANRSGESENNSAEGVFKSLGTLPDLIIEGGKTPGEPGSTILDVSVFPPRVLREGVIPASSLLAFLNPSAD